MVTLNNNHLHVAFHNIFNFLQIVHYRFFKCNYWITDSNVYLYYWILLILAYLIFSSFSTFFSLRIQDENNKNYITNKLLFTDFCIILISI